MVAPTTVTAAGYFSVTRAGASLGDGIVRMQTGTKGALELGGQTITMTGDVAAKTLKGKLGGQAFNLKIKTSNLLSGKVGVDQLELVRQVRRPIPADEMAKYDAGPPAGSSSAGSSGCVGRRRSPKAS